MKANKFYFLIILLFVLFLTGCDIGFKKNTDNSKEEVIDIVDPKEFIGEYHYSIGKNDLRLSIELEEDNVVYFLSYYPENSNRASEEIKGTWDKYSFNTKDNNVLPYTIGNYNISNVELLEDGIGLDIKFTDFVSEDYSEYHDYLIPSNSYILTKRKFILVDGHKVNYGTYNCVENGNTLILKEDGTYIKKYAGFRDHEYGTFSVENYDMSQDNSRDMHECIVVRTNGGHGGYIAKSDYSLKDSEWYVYSFSSYDQE